MTSGHVDQAARHLREGGLAVYPTDTLWALGTTLDRPDSVRRVFTVKERPMNQPLSIAVASVSEIATLATLTPLARRLTRLLPGGITLVLDRGPAVPPEVTGGSTTVGIRVPDHPQALALLRLTGPLTCTSANIHGAVEPRTIEEARRQLGPTGIFYLDGAPLPKGSGSTIVDARGAAPVVLRAGLVDAAAIDAAARADAAIL